MKKIEQEIVGFLHNTILKCIIKHNS